MDNILDTIKNKSLTYQQKVLELARVAENSIDVLDISKEAKGYMDEGIICDLFEGNAPYRPRYILPDYKKFMENGSEFLGLKPPTNLLEAVNNLLIIYKHVPSITSFPVFLGELDDLLDPFIEDEDSAYEIIKLFLTHLDRTLTDSFVHANIGPKATKAGRLILRAEKELKNAVPNLSLKYTDETPEDFALEAIETGFEAAKPYFVNHEMYMNDFNTKYGICSCYNGLPIGGGSFTLVRLNLYYLAKKSNSPKEFIEVYLPKAVSLMNEIMDKRIKFIVEESGFFESNFLAREGLIDKDRFTAMFGIYGVAECVNYLLKAEKLEDKYGHNDEADELAYDIIKALEKEVNKHTNPYCKISNNKYLLHAQSGISSDKDVTPGCRIPIGEEPELLDHIMHASKFHQFFPTGISDIFTFESTAKNNPKFILDIINGAMKKGLRMFSFYQHDGDFIRITGYLVKKSEMNKFKAGSETLHDTVALGLEAVENQRLLERKVRKND